MTSEKTQKMLERVRALLAKADSTEFPGEAESFRSKADALMTQYAIDQWMVNAAQEATDGRPKPEARYFDFSWWYDSERRSELWELFCDTAYHCRCVVALRGHGTQSYKKMPVIGIPSDLDYLDMLFTDLMLQMGKQLEPRPDANGELGEQVYLLRQAGQPWPRITEQIFKVGLVTPTKKERAQVEAHRDMWRNHRQYGEKQPVSGSDVTWDELKNSMAWTDMKNRLANANRRYVKEHNLQDERNYVKPGIYQRSFAIGFVEEVGRRFRAMVREQTAEHSGSMELALRDIREVALSLYEEMWPTPERDPNAKRSRTKMVKSPTTDWQSIEAGREAGAKADISGHQSRRVSGQRGIGEGA